MNLVKQWYFDCECSSMEHTARFNLTFWENEEPSMYMDVYLSTGGFWHRVKHAIAYVLGKKCNYGDFGSWLVKENDIERIKKMIHDYEQGLNEFKAKQTSI
jgi:hypothetical protein